MHDVLVCDVDEKKFEGLNPGLLCTAVSRGTTLGNDNGTNSAIYFKGCTFKADRIRNLTCSNDGTTFKKVTERNRWVLHIEMQRQKTLDTVKGIMKTQQETLQWATTQQYSMHELLLRIEEYKHR